jgi:hypothetical protein
MSNDNGTMRKYLAAGVVVTTLALTWWTTSASGTAPSEKPSPGLTERVFDHTACQAKSDGQTYWMEGCENTSDKVANFRLANRKTEDAFPVWWASVKEKERVKVGKTVFSGKKITATLTIDGKPEELRLPNKRHFGRNFYENAVYELFKEAVKPYVKKASALDEAKKREQEKYEASNGTSIVGEDILPGTYVTEGAPAGCYWERTDSTGRTIANNFITGSTRVQVTIYGSDYSFTNEGCGTLKRQ